MRSLFRYLRRRASSSAQRHNRRLVCCRKCASQSRRVDSERRRRLQSRLSASSRFFGATIVVSHPRVFARRNRTLHEHRIFRRFDRVYKRRRRLRVADNEGDKREDRKQKAENFRLHLELRAVE